MTLTLSGLTTNGAITDLQTIQPFAKATIADSVSGDLVTATIAFTAADGTLSGAGLSAGVVSGQTVTYTLAAATPGTLQTELQRLTFTPTAHQSAAGTSVTTAFNLTVTDVTTLIATTPTLVTTLSSGVNAPLSLATDAAGDVFVANYDGNTVEKFNASGVLVQTLQTGISSPYGVATDAAGDVFVANSGNDTVEEFNAAGALVRTLSNGIAAPSSVTTDAAGDVFVANYAYSTVEKFNASGALVETLSYGLNSPYGVAIDTAGHVFVASAGDDRVEEFNASGGLVRTLQKGVSSPYDVATDAAGDVFVANYGNNTVEEFNASGALVRTLSNGVSNPYSLATDAAGDVFVANYGNNTVEEFNASGARVATLSSGVNSPASVATDTAGDVFVANYDGNTVEKFNVSQFVSVSNSATSVTVTQSGPPVLAGSSPLTGQTTTSEAVVNPFAGVSLIDSNSGSPNDTLTITVSGTGGTLSGTGLSGGANGVFTLSGSAATVTSELDALTFMPIGGQANTTSTTTFTLAATSSADPGAPSNALSASVIDTDPAVASTITGTVAGQTTTSEAPLTPFSGVTIGDANAGSPTETLTITLNGGGGTLSGTGLLATSTSGVYTISGSASTITSELDALTFKPNAGQANTTSTTTFTLSDQNSAYATATTDTTTSVVDTDPAPTITLSGLTTNGAITDLQTIKPFATAGVAESIPGDLVSATISFTAADGTLSGAGLSAGVVNGQTVTYTLAAATPTALQSELQALTFTPTAHQAEAGTVVTTAFDLSVTDVSTLTAATPTLVATLVAPLSSGPNNPYSVATDTAGDLFVANVASASVEEFNASGVLVRNLSAGASNPQVVSVATDAAGNVFVANFTHNTVNEFDTSGTLVRTLATGLNPSRLATDAAGDIYVANQGNDNVEEFDAAGTLVRTLTNGVSSPEGVVIDSAGDVFVSNAGYGTFAQATVEEFNAAGVLVRTLTNGVSSINGVATDAAGDVFVVKIHSVDEFNAAGVLVRTLTNGISNPTSVATDAAGDVFIADQRNNAVEEFNAAGVLMATLTSGVNEPINVATDATGDVFVANRGGKIEEFNVSQFVSVSDTTTSVAVTQSGPPTLTTSSTLTGQTTTSEAPVTPFAGVSMGDSNTGSPIDTLTITVGGAGGALAGSGLTATATAGVYTITGSAATVTSELDALTFTPTAGQANTTATTTFTLAATSSADPGAPSNALSASVIDTDPAVASTITGTVAGQTTTSEAPLTPFSGVTIGDANAGSPTETLTITLSGGGGTLKDGSGFSGLTGSGSTYTLTGTAVQITSELDALTFTATAGQANTTSTTTFALSDQNSTSASTATDMTTTVVDTDPAVAPTITGINANQTTANNAAVSPFAGVSVSDANNGGTNVDTLTITLAGAGGGTLNDGSGFSGLTGSSSTYTLTGTAAQITSELDALIFTPTTEAPNTSFSTTFNLSLSDSATIVYASTPTVLASFNGADGSFPEAGLIADSDGDLFGTTGFGGANRTGTVFEIVKTASGYASTPIVLASFIGANGANGATPVAGLIADANGDLFGTTVFGGANGGGTVFEIVKTGSVYASTPTVLASFNRANGANPRGGLIADSNGDLFGTTEAGGNQFDGTVFEIVKTGSGYASTPTLLASFSGGNGAYPLDGLIADANGDLFGTTVAGGAHGDGTVFEIVKTASGYASAPTVLASFDVTHGANPESGLIADANGDLFGTTQNGGTYGDGTVYEIVKTGTVYASTPTVLASFIGAPNGGTPYGSLIADANGDLFGTTVAGGAHGDGTVFEIVKTGSGYAPTPTVLASFSDDIGANPLSGSLFLDASGNLFGTTSSGGANGLGTVFEIATEQFIGQASANLTVTDSVAAVASTITGTVASQKTTSEAVVKPFSGVTIGDVNANTTETLTITLGGAGGTLSGSGLVATATAGVYTLSGSASTITSELDALTFRPNAGQANTTSTTTFTLSDKSSAYASATTDTATSVIDTDPAAASTISGTVAGQKTTSEAIVKPFSGVTIGDANANTTDTLTITLGGVGGTLSGTGLVATSTAGVYTLSGSALTVTAELDALTFKPNAGQANTISTTTFTLSDQNSAYATATTDTATTVTDTDPGVAPTISGTVAGQFVGDQKTINPLAQVTVSDPNASSSDTIIALISGGGTLSGTGVTYAGATGLYTIGGASLAALNSNIDAAVYTPAASGVAQSVTIQIADYANLASGSPSAGLIASATNSATTITVDPGPTALWSAATFGHSQTFDITGLLNNLIKPGLTGDVETITALTTTARSISDLNGVVKFTTPVSGPATINYTVQDQYGDTASNQIAVTVDPGPTLTAGSVTIGHGETLDLTSLVASLWKPGFVGDSEYLTSVSATAGSAAIVNNGLTYTAPASGTATVSYTIVDNYGDTAANKIAVTVDPGPTTGKVADTLQVGTGINLTAQVLAAATPGLKGDTLTITAVNGSSTLGNYALVNGQLIYAASSSGTSHIAANGTLADTLGYKVSDQYGDTVSGTVAITVTNPADTITGGYLLGFLPTGFATIEGTFGTDIINAGGSFDTIYANGGNDVINATGGEETVYTSTGDVVTNLGGYSNTVSGGDGWNTIEGSQGSTTISLGNGNNTIVAAGTSNMITLGSGSNTISGGQGLETIVVGAGSDMIGLGGYSNAVTLNGSHATVSGGQGYDTITVNGSTGTDSLTFAGWYSDANISGVANVNINDLGAALTVHVGSSTQSDVITGLGTSDPYGVVDLLNGAGGYASTAQIMSHLTSDGHGGTLLALGTTGSIDFANTSTNHLSAANFRIG